MMLSVWLIFLEGLLLISAATITQLKWQPEQITKESILAEHMKLSNEILFSGVPTLAFVTQWNPRGFLLAKKRANHLDFVSNVWFNVAPAFGLEQMENVVIRGENDINRDFIRTLRKSNPDIKIVPRFFFTKFGDETADYFVKKETLVQKTAQKIANLCHRHGFDGVVIDGIETFVHSLRESKMETIEMFMQIGNVIRRNELIAILSIPALAGAEDYGEKKQKNTSPLTQEECSQLTNSYDFVQLWTYTDGITSIRHHINDQYLLANLQLFRFSTKIFLGMNFYGLQYNLKEYRAGPRLRPWETITSKQFLEVLKLEDSVLTWNEKNKEHELVSESQNTFILFPSLTTLEYRLALAKEHNVGVAFWDYGQGLDYFTNLA
ncbi:Protein CBG06565 [Caenorhabditis briggsae]|uniref:Chitinase domain-containing protein 1 n=2 Tax=Caenorhabditis briggsae TaxID=6238 RepID=A0AAE9A3R7_CAEBR|nr:Protein CBG06565 [Caenorhabditis briggsae]ULT88085.1 hypothetical protein L3Y34_007351 [Caenorhabditis briggsae]UMM33881.1 hypothetical protein L5515_007195 [Caenorhabditis briggsae]CAP26856.1 Protein CBG06565 [Caenorhabditis briggsae]